MPRKPAPKKQVARKPKIGIIMGSKSDWPTMKLAADILDVLGIPYEARVVSAHRTPKRLYDYAGSAMARGLKAIIAGAGGAAHLPGMVASMTQLPVLGVPVESKALKGLDSLLSIAQMPGGIPVATFAIGPAGAKNAGLFAAALLGLEDPALARRLGIWRERQTQSVVLSPEDPDPS
jgi:5-(carboxyamino)imidazole ribonucleotide mutase